MKYYFITNPAAGKKDSCAELCEAIEKTAEERGIDYEIYKTTGVGDATRFVKQTCETNDEEMTFFACGGDGTLNEVVSGAVGYKNAAVGLLPVGSGNDFVRNFIDKELFFDIGAQLDGEIVETDVLKCNDKYAINMVNIGFDCEVVKVMMRIKRSPLVPSGLAYIFGLVATLIKKPGVVAEVSLDGGEWQSKNMLLTTIANGCFCGGGFHSNPLARLTDGELDSLMVNNISRTKFIGLVSSYKKGTHLVPKNAKILSSASARSIDFRFPSTRSISIDGEINDVENDLHIEVMRGGLKFVIPAGSAFLKEEKARNKEAASV